ncbi:YoaK family protein [Methylobacterium sp. J-076]|uniref:YoaK family protein n=1 Tax=Methylobacterium sp. J-076 TaxID=2836655 RepID=UPI001FB97138|nr:YoaK family protein [Methylobacterium sp. J-076]MCJ2015079.1 DUF1275 domain-containing protein [Methylobacterium sp. J-076]
MNRRWQLGTGLVLTALAGYVDALGFVRLGGLYTSFMSGNTTQFAVYLGEWDAGRVLMPLALVAVFLAGAILGSTVALLVPARWTTPAVLALETGLMGAALGIGLTAPEPGLASLAIAMAMGAQNAVLSGVKGFRAGTTFVTGALFSFGQRIAEALTGRGSRLGWVGDGFVWLSLLVGAFLGALAYRALNLYALIPPAAVTAVFAGITTLLIIRAGPAAKVSR